MSRLTPEDQSVFAEFASAVLAQRELIDLVIEQEESGAGTGTEDKEARRRRDARIVQPAGHLLQLLLEFRKRYPEITAYRFRGHVFLLREEGGEPMGMLVMPDAAIEHIDR